MPVRPTEISDAEKALSNDLKQAIRAAAANIEKFHAAQRREPLKVETTPGVFCWRKGVPIDKVGIYIPGGSAPLFSTVLMLGIPAKLAGAARWCSVLRQTQQAKVNPAILFAANLVGVTQIFKAGGAQAIAAMAYGTETHSGGDIRSSVRATSTLPKPSSWLWRMGLPSTCRRVHRSIGYCR